MECLPLMFVEEHDVTRECLLPACELGHRWKGGKWVGEEDKGKGCIILYPLKR